MTGEEIPEDPPDAVSDGDSAGPVGNGFGNDVDRGLALIAEGAALVSGARVYALSDVEVREAVAGAAQAMARVEAAFLHQVVLRSPGQAFRDVAAARVLDRSSMVAGNLTGADGATGAREEAGGAEDGRPAGAGGELPDGGAPAEGAPAEGAVEPGGLPVMVAAFRSGEISRAHLDVAVRTLGKVPAHLASRVYGDGRTGTQRVDSYLAEHSRIFPPSGTERLGRHLLAVLNPDGLERYDPAAFQRRSLTCAVDWTGMLVGRFQLDPASGACLKAALDRFSAPHPATPVNRHNGEPDVGPDPVAGTCQPGDSGTDRGNGTTGGTDQDGGPDQGVLVPDARTRAQRLADGLTAIARLAMAADGATVRSEPPHILILATPEQVTAATRTRGSGRTLPSRWAEPETRRTGSNGDNAPAGSVPTGGAAHGGALPCSAEPGEAEAPDAQVGDAQVGDAQPGHAQAGDARPGHAQAGDARPGGAAGLADCVQTGPITPGTLGRFLCDAVLQTVVLDEAGAVLNLGRRVRSATRAQRAALTARDRGCAIPGCPAPPSMCEAHHVREWTRGGPPDITNLALLCSTHHTAVHAEHWQLKMIDGVPWAIPPAGLDPARQPIRRRICDAEDQARKLGQQLRLNLEIDNREYEQSDPFDESGPGVVDRRGRSQARRAAA